jgi:hypothetical protein
MVGGNARPDSAARFLMTKLRQKNDGKNASRMRTSRLSGLELDLNEGQVGHAKTVIRPYHKCGKGCRRHVGWISYA